MFESAIRAVGDYLERVKALHAAYRAGEVRARTPPGLLEVGEPLDDAVAACLPRSHAALEAARQGLFFSLPVAFDPAESIGCYLATVDRDERGEPYRFLDMGAQIATRAFGENDAAAVEALVRELPCAVNRYAHSEYQTALSLRMKAALDRIAPEGTPRHFVVNTGAEAVENAIKAVLLNRVKKAGEKDGGVIISFDGAFHGRTLGALAVTHRKKARLGFPTFEWPQAIFPTEDPRAPAATQRREERSLKQVFDLITGRPSGGAQKAKEAFRQQLQRIDAFLLPLPEGEAGARSAPGEGARAEDLISPSPQPSPSGRGRLAQFLTTERAAVAPEAAKHARHIAAVLIEPIQGEGGVRLASARFFRRLRLLTRIHDVPLIFDEVQTGFGMTGRMWAHEHFELPSPPDVVTWAKKAQNGVLFVSEELATFFQEEKKFNTTWEGDSAGMVRLLEMLGRLDLAEVQRTGAGALAALEGLAREYPELVQNVRGKGVMLGFDVARADWRDVVRDRAFRRGLLVLPAGERGLRFYPRYDTTPAAIAEAVAILKAAIEDTLTRTDSAPVGPRVRVGALDVPLACVEAIDLDQKSFAELRPAIMAVEIERYGSLSHYPPDVLRAGRRPLLQYPAEALEVSIGNARSIGLALRDRVSGRIIAYALGSPLENYDEEGVRDDPHFGENDTFYLQAIATLPSVRNDAEIANHLFDLVRARAAAAGYEYLSTLIEERLRAAGPAWLRDAAILKSVENYLRSGFRFVYVQVPLAPQRKEEP